jgi:hypothetical protein
LRHRTQTSDDPGNSRGPRLPVALLESYGQA